MTDGQRNTPLRTGLRVFAIGILVCVIIGAAALAVLAPLSSGQRRSEQVTKYDLRIQRQAAAFRATLVRWQLFLEPHFDQYRTRGAKFAPSDIARGAEISNSQIKQATALTGALRARNRE